jgi:hypothetical protein
MRDVSSLIISSYFFYYFPLRVLQILSWGYRPICQNYCKNLINLIIKTKLTMTIYVVWRFMYFTLFTIFLKLLVPCVFNLSLWFQDLYFSFLYQIMQNLKINEPFWREWNSLGIINGQIWSKKRKSKNQQCSLSCHLWLHLSRLEFNYLKSSKN